MQFRLSILMFLQFALPGAMLPLYSMRLKELGFTPMELAICCATHGVGALLAPLGAQLADRYFAAEKCVAVFSLLSSLFLIGLAYAKQQLSHLQLHSTYCRLNISSGLDQFCLRR